MKLIFEAFIPSFSNTQIHFIEFPLRSDFLIWRRPAELIRNELNKTPNSLLSSHKGSQYYQKNYLLSYG